MTEQLIAALLLNFGACAAFELSMMSEWNRPPILHNIDGQLIMLLGSVGGFVAIYLFIHAEGWITGLALWVCSDLLFYWLLRILRDGIIAGVLSTVTGAGLFVHWCVASNWIDVLPSDGIPVDQLLEGWSPVADDELMRQKQAELEQRRLAALAKIAVTSTSMDWSYPSLPGCEIYKMNVTIRNNSLETITTLGVGWVFLPPRENNCPTYVQTNYQKDVRLHPGDSMVMNIGLQYDGPARDPVSYCFKATDVQIDWSR